MLRSSFHPTSERSVPMKAMNSVSSGSRNDTAANCISRSSSWLHS